MRSDKPITLPPEKRRCFHIDGVPGSRCDILTLAEFSKGYIAKGLNITRTVQAKQALDGGSAPSTGSPLSRDFAGRSFGVETATPGTQAPPASTPQNDWSLILSEVSKELEQQEE